MSEILYFDNAATSFPKPDCVFDAADRWLRGTGAAFGRGTHGGTDSADRMVGQCRQRIAQLLDVPSSDRIAFTFNGTDGLNLLLRGFLRPGSRVITTDLEHNSVLRPLHQLQQELGLSVTWVPVRPETGQIDLNTLQQELTAASADLLVLNHASNVTGTVQPAEEASRMIHAAGGVVLLDAAQTVGHIPVSVQRLGIDLLAAPGHKGLLGPLGTGFVYVAPELEDRLQRVRSGGTGTDSDSPDQPRHMPALLESGNLNLPGIAGLNAGVEWLQKTGIETLHQRGVSHRRQILEELHRIPECVLYDSPDTSDDANTGMISFTLAGLDSRDVGMMLEQSGGIRCRTGLHCAPRIHRSLQTLDSGGTVRISPGPFTTAEQIEQLIRTLQEIAAVSSGD